MPFAPLATMRCSAHASRARCSSSRRISPACPPSRRGASRTCTPPRLPATSTPSSRRCMRLHVVSAGPTKRRSPPRDRRPRRTPLPRRIPRGSPRLAARLAGRLLLPGRAAAGTRQCHRPIGGVRGPTSRRPGDVARNDGAGRLGPARGSVRRRHADRGGCARDGRARQSSGGRLHLSDPRQLVPSQDQRRAGGTGVRVHPQRSRCLPRVSGDAGCRGRRPRDRCSAVRPRTAL